MNQLLQQKSNIALRSAGGLTSNRSAIPAPHLKSMRGETTGVAVVPDRMRLGMMQPYFFPYLGYFGLIHATDFWIVFDTPQYIRRGWVNRNRILADGGEPWKYARVPIAYCDQSTPIHQVLIHPSQKWKQEILSGLETYRLRRAPYYQQTRELLRELMADNSDRLSTFVVHCLKRCCEHMELPFQFRLFSEMGLELPEVTAPGDWALQTACSLGATTYVNPPGGRTIFNAEEFESRGIQLQFLEPALPVYDQRSDVFQSGLSVLDALMWNDPRAVREMITDYKLRAA